MGDIGQPYSCNQWGSQGSSLLPLIANDDAGNSFFNLFSTCEEGACYYPSSVFIDHSMTVHHMDSGWNSFSATTYVDQMLYKLENSVILATYANLAIDESTSDGDGQLNPGEEFELVFTIDNNSFYLDAYNIQAILSNDEDIYFSDTNLSFDDLNVNQQKSITISGGVLNDVVLGDNNFTLDIAADYIDLDGNVNQHTQVFDFTINVTLNQVGFPFDANSEIKTSPVVIDFDNDGDNEIIFGDKFGYVRMLDINGNEIENNVFPFETGDEIWGSLAAGYIDNDNKIDIVVTSKSKHMYVLDVDGEKLDYNTNKFLISTPALGDLDDDDDLEIVFGSYSSPAKLYAINIDGSDVEGFPLDFDKTQKGVALADFNANGRDDIVVGTENDEIFLIYDDGSIADGFPYTTGDKIRSAPSILNLGDSLLIIAASKDGSLYGINDDGTLRFSFESDDDIYTSPTFLESNQGTMIFFGSDSGLLYAVDINGQLYDGFPIGNEDENFDSFVGSIVFHDLDSDGLAEVIFSSEDGMLTILKTTDSNYSSLIRYDSFPTPNTFSYSSSANIQDIDGDGDMEIFAGTTGDVVVYDIKSVASEELYWNLYRGNYHRTGIFVSEYQCTAGDINDDGIFNVLDIVGLVNFAIDSSNMSTQEQCSADLNSDGIINVLDIVALVNIVISN